MARVLLVEDDDVSASFISSGLSARGYTVCRADCGVAADQAVRNEAFDVILLDRLLPDGDSADLLDQWRAQGILSPTLMITSMSAVQDRIKGLDAGADDYLIKPIDLDELDARLRAILRRLPSKALDSQLTCGSIEIDRLRREVCRGGVRVVLQPRELKILEELALHAGQVVTRSDLLLAVWNLRFDPKTKLIESHVSRLRDKLNARGHSDALETVRGVGYRLRTDA